MKPNDIISSRTVYEGPIFNIVKDEIVLPNGKTANRDVLEHYGASAVLPIDENGNLIFVRQYRHPVKKDELEIPAGKLEKNEDPKVCAIRELEEEIGYKSDVTFMFKTDIAVGYSSEVIYIYYANVSMITEQNLDEDEFVEIERYSLEDALDMIKSGEIEDSKTIASILYYDKFVK